MITRWDAAAFDAFERDSWTGRGAAYENGFARLTAHTIEPLLDAASVHPGDSVLDIGTGPGLVAAAALARGARVSAVDASPEMAARAAEACPDADVRIAVLPGLPFPDATFDAIVGNYVINHLGDPAAGLADLLRVLRPGGRLALTCWERTLMRATALFGEAVVAAGIDHPADLPTRGPFLAGAAEDARPAAFRDLLATAGFDQAQADHVSWLHRVDPDAWWDAVITGTPLTGSIIGRMNAGDTALVKRHYDAAVVEYRVGEPAAAGLVDLPAVAILAQGRRPNIEA